MNGDLYIDGTWLTSITPETESGVFEYKSKDFDYHREATMKVELTTENKVLIEKGGIVVDITDKNDDVLRAEVIGLTEDGVKIRMKNSEWQAMDFEYSKVVE